MLHLTLKNFDSEVKQASLPVVVMFYADWCGKCAMMKPIAEEAEKKYRREIKFCKVEIEESEILAAEYDMDIVPAFVMFKNGRIVGAMQGIIDEEVFGERIQKIFRNS